MKNIAIKKAMDLQYEAIDDPEDKSKCRFKIVKFKFTPNKT